MIEKKTINELKCSCKGMAMSVLMRSNARGILYCTVTILDIRTLGETGV